MSVDAYIVTETDVKIIDGKKYVYQKEEFLYSLWSQNEITKALLCGFADDYTNNDWIGEICISLDGWDDFKNEYMIDKKLKKVVDENKEVFQKIDEVMKHNGYEVILVCK